MPGFHYYSLVIDGVRVSDPASESFYGTGRMSSVIDIPEEKVNFIQSLIIVDVQDIQIIV